MVRLHIVSGSRAGTSHPVAHFPCVIGRASDAALRLEDAGVWEQHVRLEFERGEGFFAALQSNALGTINGEAFERRKLRNGDVIELGAVKLQFWLDSPDQRGLRWRETAVWLGLAALIAAQAWLLWRLSP